MNIGEIISAAGEAVVRNVIPGGGLILDGINAMLPGNKKLAKNATGGDIKRAIDDMPEKLRAELMSKQWDVDLEIWHTKHDSVQVMLEADSKMQHTTRPRIALMSFYVVGFAISGCICAWMYAVFIRDSNLARAVQDGWPMILSIMGPLVSLLWAYFGILRSERKDILGKLP